MSFWALKLTEIAFRASIPSYRDYESQPYGKVQVLLERFRRHICDLVPAYRSRSVLSCRCPRFSNLHIHLWASLCGVFHSVFACRLLIHLASHIGGVVDGGTGTCRIQCEKGNRDSCARRRNRTISDVSPQAGRRFSVEDLVAGLSALGWLGGSRAGGFCRARRFCV